MSAPENPAALLTRLLEEKHRLLIQFLQLTQDQTPLIEEEDIEAFQKNLEQREKIINTFETIRPKLDKLLADYKNKKFPAQSKVIDDLQQQISRNLLKITEIDKRNQKAAQERMEFFMAEVRRASDTRKGVGAYMKGAEIFAAEYVDQRQ